MMIFLLAVTLFGDFTYPRVLYFSDERAVEPGIYLRRPVDALAVGSKVFIADAEGMCIFLVEGDQIKRIGEKGSGPGKFRNHPQYFELDGESLLIYEFNFWDVSRFSLDGVYLDRWVVKDRSIRNIIKVKDVEVRTFIGFAGNPSFGRQGCGFGYLGPNELIQKEGTYRAAIGLDGAVILAHGMGRLATVDENCEISEIMALNLRAMAKDPQALENGFFQFSGKKYQLHKGGAPLMAVAAKSRSQVWCLVRNERTQERVVFEVNLAAKKVVHKQSFSIEFDQIRYSNGMLILLSRLDATVVGYQIH